MQFYSPKPFADLLLSTLNRVIACLVINSLSHKNMYASQQNSSPTNKQWLFEKMDISNLIWKCGIFTLCASAYSMYSA